MTRQARDDKAQIRSPLAVALSAAACPVAGADPTIVEIGWDGNTALDLANFGLEIQPAASTPKPATLALLSVGLAGLAFSRRRKPS